MCQIKVQKFITTVSQEEDKIVMTDTTTDFAGRILMLLITL